MRFADLLFFLKKIIYCVYFDTVPLARVNQMQYNDLAIKNCISNEWMLLNFICDNNPQDWSAQTRMGSFFFPIFP